LGAAAGVLITAFIRENLFAWREFWPVEGKPQVGVDGLKVSRKKERG